MSVLRVLRTKRIRHSLPLFQKGRGTEEKGRTCNRSIWGKERERKSRTGKRTDPTMSFDFVRYTQRKGKRTYTGRHSQSTAVGYVSTKVLRDSYAYRKEG